MLVLNIKKIIKNKMTLVMFCLVSTIIVLSIVVYTLSMKLNISRGTIIKDIIGKMNGKSNVLNMQTYYAEFEMTVISN